MLENPKDINATTHPVTENVKRSKSLCIESQTRMDDQQPSLDDGTKVCRVCKEEKTVYAFKTYSSRGKKLRRNICTLCEKEWHRQHYQKNLDANRIASRRRARKYREENREAYNAKNREWKRKKHEEDRNLIFRAYGGKCACCGESDIRFLTIDHVNNDGHIERKSGLYTSGSQFYRRIIQQSFPDKYQILCYNCNLGRARNGGICPHQEGSTTISSESTAKRPEAPTTHKNG